MKYTYQSFTDSGSFSGPEFYDVNHCNSVRELKQAFWNWLEIVRNHSDENVYLWVSKGRNDSIEYPDFIIKNGKNDGFTIEKC